MSNARNDLKISLITTVLNEEESLSGWIESVQRQTVRPDEIVVVDGGSNDQTVGMLRRMRIDCPVRVLERQGCNISEGRNIAISEARHDVIAVTDAGTLLDESWLEAITEPLTSAQVDVVGGFFRPAGRNWFEKILAAIIVPQLAEIDGKSFLPSSRSVAFRREAWHAAGGYPERLMTCEDLVFDLALRDRGSVFVFAPSASVLWYPRRTMAAFMRQYYGYARGDGQADLWRRRHAARYGAYSVGLLLACMCRRNRVTVLPLAAGFCVYQAKFSKRLWGVRPFESVVKMLLATAFAPLVVVGGDVAKMLGYPRGIRERRQMMRNDQGIMEGDRRTKDPYMYSGPRSEI
jgi:glycosyltransferase involved in cell wall biosynthesis